MAQIFELTGGQGAGLFACAWTKGPLEGTGEPPEGWVSIWSYPEQRLLSEFATHWDMGGRRLCLVPAQRPFLVTAAYSTHGVSAYDAVSGRRVWQRRDLKKAQNLRLLELSGRHIVGVGFDRTALTLLDPASGQTLLERRGYRQSAPLGGNAALLSNRRELRYVEGEGLTSRWSRPLHSFALLDAAGSPDQIVASEVNGPLRAFNRRGEPLWEVQESEHFVQVEWHTTTQTWLALQLDGTLFAITPEGATTQLGRTREGSSVFLEGANALACSNGEVIELPSRDSTWRFVDLDSHRPWLEKGWI